MQIPCSVDLMTLIEFERRVHSLEIVTDCISNKVLHEIATKYGIEKER